ncbi:MAG: NUDIX hydrolase [Spirochaetota bacterium]
MQRQEHLVWRELGRKRLLQSVVFDVYSISRTSSMGHEGEFIVLDSPDWVNVVPVTRDTIGRECFLMVHQYRQASQTLTIEFPGGVLDRNEKPEEGASRELVEETGYRAGDIHLAGKIIPNPAIMDNWCYTFVAENLEKVAGQVLDQLELLDYELIPVEEVQKRMGTGPYTHSLMMVALDFYNRWKTGKKYGC